MYNENGNLMGEYDGEKTVLGAGPQWAFEINLGSDMRIGQYLVSKPGTSSDDMGDSQFSQVILPPYGQDDCEFIENLKRAANAYGNNINYSFPSFVLLLRSGTMDGGYNSNSFISGVLGSAGSYPSIATGGEFQLLGFNNPIPLPPVKPAASGCGCCVRK